MKEAIFDKARQVANKVNRSAFKYMYKNTDWLNKDSAMDSEKFMTMKVPIVIAEELSKILNDALGLDPSE